MYVPLGVVSDYSLLQSLIKIPDLMKYLKKHNITTCGLLDTNLFGSICFYKECCHNTIKPIIGLTITYANKNIYLYAKNYNGYQNLLKIHTKIEENALSSIELKTYKKDIIAVLPYPSKDLYEEMNQIYDTVYLSYTSVYEKKNASLITNKIVYICLSRTYTFDEVKYLPMLREIATEVRPEIEEFTDAYLEKEIEEEDIERIHSFATLFDLEFPKEKNYIPHFDDKIEDSYAFLSSLAMKGLNKRLNNQVSDLYLKRLQYELETIKSMGFVDYFLIVYDYVKYAKTHSILVGPGRGSAAGSLVSYSIGITNIDPLKYNLLFERFLNPERITMPDIDIDFEYTKRDQVIDYVKERYGKDKVANIMTFGTLGARQVIRDVGKCLQIDTNIIDRLSNLLEPKWTLRENISNQHVKEFVLKTPKVKQLYQICFKLEGLKRHISTHAAGVVISSLPLDEVIPICLSTGILLTGCTMEYLESLGLLKMDFLALKNLTIIQNVVELIKKETGKEILLSSIPLEDKDTMQIFKEVDTEGVFQYESAGMKNFMAKLKPDTFNDLVAALALFRPGPMHNIDTFIRRKEGKEPIIYPNDSLKDILNETYGIMVYQEQIMQILVKMANYSFAEADNIRRAMSKKKHEVMEKEREVFVSRAIENGYEKKNAEEVYDLILRFADYGFNKAHSVSYALIGYQMAYLKANYPTFFIANLLNMSIGSDIKTKEYIDEAKKRDILIIKPSINESTSSYVIQDKTLRLPLNAIHNVGIQSVIEIVKTREEQGPFQDFFTFVSRTYGRSVNKKTLESLIDSDAFKEFGYNHQTLYKNMDSAIDYASLCMDLDESLVMKPTMIEYEEFTEAEVMKKEIETFGFYVTNHPASKYKEGIMKLEKIENFFDKYVDLVVIIGNVRKIKTKKGEDMGFLVGSDETGTGDFTIFPKNSKLLLDVKKDDLVRIHGQVTKRIDKYQIIVTNIEKL